MIMFRHTASFTLAAIFASMDFAVAQTPSRTTTIQPSTESPTAGIQEAIDSLGPDGGTVKLAPGRFLLRQSIRVRSNLTLLGAAAETVLYKGPQVGSKLAARVGDQDRSLRVISAAGLQVGDEIGVFDEATVGWEHSHAIVKEIRGNELIINRRIGRAFDPTTGASVVNYFPAISGLQV